MRINMPVTQRNYPVPEGTTIVTRTDAKGRIEYANDAFVSISGFTREELLGQPHNLVRHPDMPAEAFRDMWATLKRGRPWSGLVKNRRKDGDHYWVRANANPLPGGGYHSVRTAPAAQEIAAAEALYARMRQDASLALHEGGVIRRGTLATLRQQWRRVRISHRFWAWAGFATALFYLSIALGVYGLMQARDSQDRIYSGNLIPALQLGTLAEHLDGGHTALLLAMQALPGNALASAQPQLEAARANRSELERGWAEYGRIAAAPDEQALARAFEEPLQAWWRRLDGVAERIRAGDTGPAALQALLDARRTEGAAAHAGLAALREHHAAKAAAEMRLMEAQHERDFILYAILFGLGISVGTLMGWSLLHRLSRGFAAAGEAAQAIAAGNLARPVAVDGEDEIGQLLAQMSIMRNNLQEVIGELRHNMEELSRQSRELGAASANVSGTAEQQAAATNSMAAAVEQLSVSIDQVESNASEARTVTLDSARRSEESTRIIRETIDEMHRIASSVSETASSIRELEGQVGEISAIVTVIREIADQTNLLALNAAIEAARAGEQGRGFAVVADEVRKLAERTSSATVQISSMIGPIQAKARAAGSSMDHGVSRVQAGVALASRAGDELHEMRQGSTQVTEAVDAITLALQEQAAAAREIAGRVEHVSQGTDEMVATSRQTDEAAFGLQRLAMGLAELSGKFRTA